MKDIAGPCFVCKGEGEGEVGFVVWKFSQKIGGRFRFFPLK